MSVWLIALYRLLAAAAANQLYSRLAFHQGLAISNQLRRRGSLPFPDSARRGDVHSQCIPEGMQTTLGCIGPAAGMPYRTAGQHLAGCQSNGRKRYRVHTARLS